MKTAFIFPGQGSQYVGMGKDLYENYQEIRDLYNKADEILGYRLSDICFEGPPEKLKQTYITQPAIFLHSVAVTTLISDKIKADMTAGHSLGEYTAFWYAGVFSFEDGLQLVKARGEGMQKAGEKNRGTMAAIIGLRSDDIVGICSEHSEKGTVNIANHNSPSQVVISGSVDSVRNVMEICRHKGAKLVKELEVHGAFHSALMKPAEETLKSALDKVKFSKPYIPVYCNYNAKAMDSSATESEIKELLIKQLTSSVRWEEIVINMHIDGVNEFIEPGPGRVLQGLVRRIIPDSTVKGFDKLTDLQTNLN